MTEPWYLDGLCFTCTRCGGCCTGAPGYVWVNEAEIEAIAEYREIPAEAVRLSYVRLVGTALSLTEKANGDCVFYDRQAKACTIYPVRPTQCRTWPFWQSNLRTKETWKATFKICPGAGSGDFVPFEEVQRRLELIRL